MTEDVIREAPFSIEFYTFSIIFGWRVYPNPESVTKRNKWSAKWVQSEMDNAMARTGKTGIRKRPVRSDRDDDRSEQCGIGSTGCGAWWAL